MRSPVDLLLGAARKGAELAARPAGIRFLTREQTLGFLTPYELSGQPAQRVALPAVPDATASGRPLFEARELALQASRVWRLPEDSGAKLLRNGAVRVGKTVLCTDYHSRELLRHSWRPARSHRLATPLLLAPFSHYQHPTRIWGYYDYLLLVAAKLCRLLAAVPATEAAQALVSYPLFGTPYEREFLAASGLRPDQVVDSRTHAVQVGQCLLGNSGEWFYPSPSDAELLRTRLLPLIGAEPVSAARLYVSRAGRRRITNEDALVRMLLPYGFEVLEDKPRSLTEQLTLYRGASFIMGAHGASFANVLWSQPGTQLFEIFPPGYAPDYFHYLAQLRGLRYAACRQAGAPQRRGSPFDTNITVAVSTVERALNHLLRSQ